MTDNAQNEVPLFPNYFKWMLNFDFVILAPLSSLAKLSVALNWQLSSTWNYSTVGHIKIRSMSLPAPFKSMVIFHTLTVLILYFILPKFLHNHPLLKTMDGTMVLSEWYKNGMHRQSHPWPIFKAGPDSEPAWYKLRNGARKKNRVKTTNKAFHLSVLIQSLSFWAASMFSLLINLCSEQITVNVGPYVIFVQKFLCLLRILEALGFSLSSWTKGFPRYQHLKEQSGDALNHFVH